MVVEFDLVHPPSVVAKFGLVLPPSVVMGGAGLSLPGIGWLWPVLCAGSCFVVPCRMRINCSRVSTWLVAIGANGEVGARYRRAVSISWRPAMTDIVVGCCIWHWDMVRQPGECVADALHPGVLAPDCIASVRIECRSQVPSFHSMWRPCASDGGLFMNEDAYARWCNRGAVEIKWAMQFCPR